MSLPPLVVRLVGINEYTHYQHLRPKGRVNADNLEQFLTGEFIKGDGHDIKNIPDAKKEDILQELESLCNKYKRSNAILIFFSGYGGRNRDGTSIICPADMDTEEGTQGITDQRLVQLFDTISRYRGNNITFLLDYPIASFKWGNPSSFVVVAPNKAQADRQAFTAAVINVLRSEKESISTVTVQSFAAKLHAAMPSDVEIDCFGQNVDRPLFNPAGQKAHYAFISGRIETDQTLTLFAGSAHGVKPGTTYAIYKNHVQTVQDCVGRIEVKVSGHNVIKAITTRQALPPDSSLPNDFYAVETRHPHHMVNIFPDGVDTSTIKSSSWNRVDAKGGADITLKLHEGNVRFLWNGFVDSPIRIVTPGISESLAIPFDKQEDLLKAIRRAARFAYIAGPPDSASLSSTLLEVEFKEVDEDAEEPSGNNLLKDGLVSVDMTKKDPRRSFGLVLRNKSKFDLWPFVFICDPNRFTIQPWYIPTEALSSNDGARKGLKIGCGGEAYLVFRWRPGSSDDLAYIKIFVTNDPRTSFSFLEQEGTSDEDRLRELDQEVATGTLSPDGVGSSKSPQSASSANPNKLLDSDNDVWEAVQITIKRSYGPDLVTHTSNKFKRLGGLGRLRSR